MKTWIAVLAVLFTASGCGGAECPVVSVHSWSIDGGCVVTQYVDGVAVESLMPTYDGILRCTVSRAETPAHFAPAPCDDTATWGAIAADLCGWDLPVCD